MNKNMFNKAIITSVFLLIISCGIFYFNSFIQVNADNNKTPSTEITSLENKNAAIQVDIDEVKIMVAENDIKVETTDTTKNADFLTYSIASNGLTLNKFQIATPISYNDLCLTPITLEVNGANHNISNFLNALVGQPCLIKNISFRQNNNFLWLNRNTDNQTVLPWLDFETQPDSQTLLEMVTVDELKNQQDMICYLELEFISEW